jgi:hypothetical protein
VTLEKVEFLKSIKYIGAKQGIRKHTNTYKMDKQTIKASWGTGDDTITFEFTRDLLEDWWKFKITDEMWAAMKGEETGLQEAVDSEIEKLGTFIKEELDEIE